MDSKEKQGKHTRKQAAQHFGVSVSTIRAWQREFSQWLEVESGQYGGGYNAPVTYTEEDMRVFTVVHKGTRSGRDYDAIRSTLEEELNQATFDFEPEQLEDEPEQSGEEDKAIVPLTQFLAVTGKLAATEGALSAVEDERDRLLEDLKSERLLRLDAEKRAARAEGKLEERRGWLSRLFGRSN